MADGEGRKGLPADLLDHMRMLAGGLVILIVVGGAFIGIRRAKVPEGLLPTELPVEVSFPDDLPTIWPRIDLRIDSVARVSADTVVAEWAYINTASDQAEPFAWGQAQPNFAALARLRDGTGQEYPVHINAEGMSICSSTNKPDDPTSSQLIYGGRELPAWAQFNVPPGAAGPYALILHGVIAGGTDVVPVPMLTEDEQNARAFIARQTDWPNIWIRLESVKRQPDGSVAVNWSYVNRDPQSSFQWGPEEPDYVALTTLFDLNSGLYHATDKTRTGTSSTRVVTGGSQVIPANGELKAKAVFSAVTGERVQVIFHSIPPFFSAPRAVIIEPTN
jgi:hypothetical protein